VVTYIVTCEHHSGLAVSQRPAQAQFSNSALDSLLALSCMGSNLNSRVFMRPRALSRKHPRGGYLHKNAIGNQHLAHSLEEKRTQRANTRLSIRPARAGRLALHRRHFAALSFDNDTRPFCRKFLILTSMQNPRGCTPCAPSRNVPHLYFQQVTREGMPSATGRMAAASSVLQVLRKRDVVLSLAMN
jgi:hypothetical protein